jgi:hypothetical protein
MEKTAQQAPGCEGVDETFINILAVLELKGIL